ncbi:MAG: hypothetical protein AMS24_02680 [Chlamydiae bacterium SM23_39]|nr:MAG: hypothetical protein AMS24_02680 [Chlamydiae bacterium SM23_39]
MKKYFFYSLFILFSTAFVQEYTPWYTGPLLTQSADNLSPGQGNIQPYLFVLDSFAEYDSSWHRHRVDKTIVTNTLLFLQFGIFQFLDGTLRLSGFYKHKKNKDIVKLGDSAFEFGIQLLKDKKNSNIPSVRVVISERFPTGKYDNLNPNKGGIDATGKGCYETFVSLNLSKIVYWIKMHPTRFRLSLSYSFPSKVSVKNFNSYGGGYNTSGKVTPPNLFITSFSFEYSFNRNWVYAMDFLCLKAKKTKFSGNPGTTIDGKTASNAPPSLIQISIAPAIEYNFSKNLGIITGAWLSIAGKNVEDFISYVFSVTYTF